MKKYTNKILIITAIILMFALIIGYTIDFQTGIRSGRIKYEQREIDTDSLEMVIRDALNEEEPDTSAMYLKSDTSQQDETKLDAK